MFRVYVVWTKFSDLMYTCQQFWRSIYYDEVVGSYEFFFLRKHEKLGTDF